MRFVRAIHNSEYSLYFKCAFKAIVMKRTNAIVGFLNSTNVVFKKFTFYIIALLKHFNV